MKTRWKLPPDPTKESYVSAWQSGVDDAADRCIWLAEDAEADGDYERAAVAKVCAAAIRRLA